VRSVLFSPKTALFIFGGTSSRTPCNGSVMTIAGLLRVERYLSVFAVLARFEAKFANFLDIASQTLAL
jgi:hypothetical protein